MRGSSTARQNAGADDNSVLRIAILGGPTNSHMLVSRLQVDCAWCRCESVSLDKAEDLASLADFDAVLLIDKPTLPGFLHSRSDSSQLHRQMEILTSHRICCVVLTERPWAFAGFTAGVVCISSDTSVEKLHGVLLGLTHAVPLLRRVDERLGAVQRLGRSLESHFAATDRELQLASRVQQDFLPHQLPIDGPVRFTTLFRPCSWVSGDIFDIFRLDETHWGFYLADAVGHGVAAGLLTMYIKHAIATKRIYNSGYELVPPGQVLCDLNDKLVSQNLADSRFVTMWYGMINMANHVLHYAVAGHPPPLVIDEDGGLQELHGDGCMLGLETAQTFGTQSIMLRPGQRVFVYSDGLESAIIANRLPMPRLPVLETGIGELLRRPAHEVIATLNDRLDGMPGGLTYADDVSLIIADIVE